MSGRERMSGGNSDLPIYVASLFLFDFLLVQEFCLALYVLSHFVMHQSDSIQIQARTGAGATKKPKKVLPYKE